MLARAASFIGQKAPKNRSNQINKRSCASQAQAEGSGASADRFANLKSVVDNATGAKRLTEVYQAQLAELENFHRNLAQEFLQTPDETQSVPVRNAVGELANALKQLGAGLDSEEPSGLLEVPKNIDDVMEVHGVADLYAAYNQAFAALPHVDTATDLPLDFASESAASIVADLEFGEQQLRTMLARAQVKADASTKSVVDLMYAKADDYLLENPNFEAQMEEEIKENRWDLLYKDEDA